MDKQEIELLNSQKYKNYFFFFLVDNFKNKKIFILKIFIAYIISFLFDFINLFEGYSFFMTYFILEVLLFNLIDTKEYKP